jgi:hypothetical protein
MATVDLSTSRRNSEQDSVSPGAGAWVEPDPVARGRALAQLALEEMIAEIKRRAERHLLDRGLRVSLPYFDDRRMALRYWEFTVIPKGRILFVPAFVVLAAEREVPRAQATREFTPTTRQHLLNGLHQLAAAFGPEMPQPTSRSCS